MSYFEISDIEQAIRHERRAQDAKFGPQNHPDGTGPNLVWTYTGPAAFVAEWAKRTCAHLAEEGCLTWMDILTEEVAEAYAEEDPAKLREELLQVASVAIAWVEAIDRRTPAAAPALVRCTYSEHGPCPAHGGVTGDMRLVDGANGGA